MDLESQPMVADRARRELSQDFRYNYAGGNARVHYGNIINDIHYHSGYDVEAQRRWDVLQHEIDAAKRTENIINDFSQWLGAEDPSFVHYEAHNKHEPGTGRWLIDSSEFSNWLQGGSRVLWLYGKAGCCKTTLCSIIIEEIMEQIRGPESSELAYFYLSFRDAAKQNYQSWLLSVITQMLEPWRKKAGEFHLSLDRLMTESLEAQGESSDFNQDDFQWSDSERKLINALTPLKTQNRRHPRALEPVLDALISSKTVVYLVTDGLDESPESCDVRQEIMQGLQRIESNHRNVKLLVTSRREADIESTMGKFSDQVISIEVNPVNEDIKRYVNNEMKRHRTLSALLPHSKAEIISTLTEKADGMFRWVFCQLDQIKRLKLLSPVNISRALRDLPATLDETYERILMQYDGIEEVKIAMEWLAFSLRPLDLYELREACLVTFDEPYVQEGGRKAIDDLLLSMTSLLQFDHHDDNTQLVSLGHSSVREYILSARTQSSGAGTFYLSEALSHAAIARRCIAYILHCCCRVHTCPECGIEYDEEKTDCAFSCMATQSDLATRHSHGKPHFQLLGYSVDLWIEHKRCAAAQYGTELDKRLQTLLLSGVESSSFLRNIAVKLWPDASYSDPRTIHSIIATQSSPAGYGLVLASHEGLSDVVQDLVCDTSFILGRENDLGIALVAAARAGWEQEVKCLLEGGASVDHVCSGVGTALEQALYVGHMDIASLLLEHSADHGHLYESQITPLQRASTDGRLDIVRLLLDHKADPNLSPILGTPLQRAARCGHEEIVLALLKAGGDPNLLANIDDGTPIQWASRNQHLSCVRLLCEYGGDPNKDMKRTLEEGEPAIEHAVRGKNLDMVKILIEAGTYYGLGRSLHAAFEEEAFDIVQLLLDTGAHERLQDRRSLLALAIKHANKAPNLVEAVLSKGVNIDGLQRPFIVGNSKVAKTLAKFKVRCLYQEYAQTHEFAHWYSNLAGCLYLMDVEDPATPRIERRIQSKQELLPKRCLCREPHRKDLRRMYIRWTDEHGDQQLDRDPPDFTIPCLDRRFILDLRPKVSAYASLRQFPLDPSLYLWSDETMPQDEKRQSSNDSIDTDADTTKDSFGHQTSRNLKSMQDGSDYDDYKEEGSYPPLQHWTHHPSCPMRTDLDHLSGVPMLLRCLRLSSLYWQGVIYSRESNLDRQMDHSMPRTPSVATMKTRSAPHTRWVFFLYCLYYAMADNDEGPPPPYFSRTWGGLIRYGNLPLIDGDADEESSSEPCDEGYDLHMYELD